MYGMYHLKKHYFFCAFCLVHGFKLLRPKYTILMQYGGWRQTSQLPSQSRGRHCIQRHGSAGAPPWTTPRAGVRGAAANNAAGQLQTDQEPPPCMMPRAGHVVIVGDVTGDDWGTVTDEVVVRSCLGWGCKVAPLWTRPQASRWLLAVPPPCVWT